MTSLRPRPPYTDEELQKLYPPGLELQLVQVLLRHGERTPVSARFQNTGLPGFWPYCASVRELKSAVLHDRTFTTMEWKRRLETFGPNDNPVIATGPRGEIDDVCDMGSLTDKGRQTTYDLGRRLRSLYVDRLKFLPPAISSADFLYLRSTPMPRALESLQQTLSALYPQSTRLAGPDGAKFLPPTILTRAHGDETLYPNDGNCRRFAALSRAFAQRAADRWNDTPEMEYLNRLYGKWMPDYSPRVAVDSRPRLSGIMDSINSTKAHGPETRLPKEFYDEKGHRIIERIGVEEWFAGYQESREYRMLGIGGLMGDIVARMAGSAERSVADGEYEVMRRKTAASDETTPPTHIKFGLSGCHDTTLAGVLSSLGAFDMEHWPPFTSHIAFEMFRGPERDTAKPVQQLPAAAPAKRTFWGGLVSPTPLAGTPPPGIGRKKTEDLSPEEKAKLEGYYVRIRYNDEIVTVPGCRAQGKHLEGDESFCTLVS